jgi:hypothetical protein
MDCTQECVDELKASFDDIFADVRAKLEDMFEEWEEDQAELDLRRRLTVLLPEFEERFEDIKSDLKRIKRQYGE